MQMANPTDWTQILETFGATVAGGGVGVLGVFLVFRRESKERYESRLTDALVRVLDEIAKIDLMTPKFEPKILRENQTVASALLMAASMSRDIDLDLIYVLYDACNSPRHDSEGKQRELMVAIKDAIVGWRGQQEDPRLYMGVLKRFSEESPPSFTEEK